MIIILDWPDASLSPNRKNGKSWVSTVSRKDGYRRMAAFYVRYALAGEIKPIKPYKLVITFVQPDKRRRDLDNLLATIKPGLDGIAYGLGIDDYDFEQITLKREFGPKPGCVKVEFL